MMITRWLKSLIGMSTISWCSLINLASVMAEPNLTATATSSSNNLSITFGNSAEIVQVADLQISTSAPNGLKLSISPNSLNKNDGTPIPLQFLVVPDGSNQPSAASFIAPAITTYEYTLGAAGSQNLDLYVKYTPGLLQDPGNYTSVMELSVADNP
jgi:hypothetical protein